MSNGGWIPVNSGSGLVARSCISVYKRVIVLSSPTPLIPYFPDYEHKCSSQKCVMKGKTNPVYIHISRSTISRLYLEINFTKPKTKNRHLIWKGKLFNYTIAEQKAESCPVC